MFTCTLCIIKEIENRKGCKHFAAQKKLSCVLFIVSSSLVLYFAIVDPISRSALGGLQRRPISKAWTSAPGGSSCPQYTAGGLVPNGVDAESGNGGEARRGAASTASP
jgi:hypothetical protein